MDTKTLLAALTGFFVGGLLVSLAATTFDKQELHNLNGAKPENDMVMSLQTKKGDDFDKIFLAQMIAHHESAVETSKLSAKNAKHTELKQLSEQIINTQTSEINRMRQWQVDWGYNLNNAGQVSH